MLWYSEMKRILTAQIARIVVGLLVCSLAVGYAAKDKHALRDLSTHITGIAPRLQTTLLSGLVATRPTPTQVPILQNPEVSIQSIYNFIDAERHKNGLSTLRHDKEVEKIAGAIAQGSADLGLQFEELNTQDIITRMARQYKLSGYTFAHDTLLGVQSTDDVLAQWLTQGTQAQYLVPNLETAAIATATATIEGRPTGVVVTVFTKKTQAQKAPQSAQPASQPDVVFPSITNESVLSALNAYRQVHGVAALSEHPNLCAYAEKRLTDLLKFGGLDNHEGFRKDFENQDAIPQVIRDYPGHNVGENLAYQFCRNMKTNEAFVAPHATALIEWCFDSSTKGHREAQLSTAYVSACARNKEGYFVIIFGD